MTAANTPADAAAPAPEAASGRRPREGGGPGPRRGRSRARAGWSSRARSSPTTCSSIRFVVLLIVLGLAVGIPFFLASEQIRTARLAGERPAGPVPRPVPARRRTSPVFQIDVTIQSFIALVAPLLGLAFAFDAVNGERAQGTLPRLLSQPIYRDDVINGKFAAGLAVIALVLAIVVAVIAAFGIFRLGIVPAPQELLRIVIWLLVTFIYVAFWLAFGLLLSVVIRRAATSALVGFGIVVPGRAVRPVPRSRSSSAFLAPTTNELSELEPRRDQHPADVHPAAPADHALPRGVDGRCSTRSATFASTPATVGELQQAAAAGPVAPVARPEPAARLAARRRARSR